MSEPIELALLDDYVIPGLGLCFAVAAPFEMDRDYPEIKGRMIRVLGGLWYVRDVERFLPRGPIRLGEKIGLYVEHVDDDTHI